MLTRLVGEELQDELPELDGAGGGDGGRVRDGGLGRVHRGAQRHGWGGPRRGTGGGLGLK